MPTSGREKPSSGCRARRPAKVSFPCRSRAGEALPRTKNLVRIGLRSANTRSSGKSPGNRWISSKTTRPLRGSSANSASANRARSPGRSKSKTWQGCLHAACTSLASVVLPTCLAPSMATTGLSRSSDCTRVRCWGRRTTTNLILKFDGWPIRFQAVDHPLRQSTANRSAPCPRPELRQELAGHDTSATKAVA